MFCHSVNPESEIKHSPLSHRPNETRLATCALQGRHKLNSGDPGTKQPEKFLRMFLCRPGTLRSLLPYITSAALSSGCSEQYPVPHSTNHVCSSGFTASRDPAALLLWRAWQARHVKVPGQRYTITSVCNVFRYLRRSPQGDSSPERARNSSRTKCGIGGLASKDRLHAAPDPVGSCL